MKREKQAEALMKQEGLESTRETEAICSDDELMNEIHEGLQETDRRIYTLEELFVP